MTDREHYLGALRDIEEWCTPDASDYRVIQSSALIRKLFLDGVSLVDLVNRQHRVPIVFDVLDPGVVHPPGTPDVRFGISAGFVFPDSPARRRKRKEAFFKMSVGQLMHERVTVYDLVQYVAHVLGGVHLKGLDTRSKEILAAIDKLYEANELFAFPDGRAMSVAFFRNLGPIIMDALKPLTERLKGG